MSGKIDVRKKEARLVEDGRAFLLAVEALCDWMNDNDMAADHQDQRPDDFKRVSETMERFRATLGENQ